MRKKCWKLTASVTIHLHCIEVTVKVNGNWSVRVNKEWQNFTLWVNYAFKQPRNCMNVTLLTRHCSLAPIRDPEDMLYRGRHKDTEILLYRCHSAGSDLKKDSKCWMINSNNTWYTDIFWKLKDILYYYIQYYIWSVYTSYHQDNNIHQDSVDWCPNTLSRKCMLVGSSWYSPCGQNYPHIRPLKWNTPHNTINSNNVWPQESLTKNHVNWPHVGKLSLHSRTGYPTWEQALVYSTKVLQNVSSSSDLQTYIL